MPNKNYHFIFSLDLNLEAEEHTSLEKKVEEVAHLEEADQDQATRAEAAAKGPTEAEATTATAWEEVTEIWVAEEDSTAEVAATVWATETTWAETVAEVAAEEAI